MHSHMHTHTGTRSFIREQGLTYHLLRWFFPLCWLQSSRCETAFFPQLHWFPTPLYLAGKVKMDSCIFTTVHLPGHHVEQKANKQNNNRKPSNKDKQTKMKWVNNCWWGWQNRTALEKWPHLYSDTQEAIKNTSAFDTWSSSGVEERPKMIKEEGSKEEDLGQKT